MAPIKRDYRNYTHPRLWSIEFLLHITKLKEEVFNSIEISEHFKLPTSEVNARLTSLKRFGFIKRISKDRPYEYEITSWGKKYMKDNKEKITAKVKERKKNVNES